MCVRNSKLHATRKDVTTQNRWQIIWIWSFYFEDKLLKTHGRDNSLRPNDFLKTIVMGNLPNLQNIKVMGEGFPRGTVVGNPSANSGDTSSSPGLGRSHMPWSNWAHAPQLLSLRSGTHEPQLLSPRATTTEAHAPKACALQQERPPQWEAHALQRRVAPTRCN